MRKKSKYIRKSDVVTVWQCPDCKKFYHVKVSDMAEIGTPVCDCEKCDCDLHFSHVLVKRPPRQRIVVTARSGDYHAQLITRNRFGLPWAAGKSPDEAIGNLVRFHPDEFAVKIVTPA